MLFARDSIRAEGPSGPELTPVCAQERILLLDLLRGLAMSGVLLSNLNDWYGTTPPSTALDGALSWMQEWLIESRFYSLLGFLFGIGFAIQLTRAEQLGAGVSRTFCRRMLALLAIGIVHGILIWRGDILTTYAAVGLLLLPFQRTPKRWVLAAAVACVVVAPYLLNAAVAGLHITFPRPMPQEQIDAIYSHGSFWQIERTTAQGYLFWHRRWPLFVFPPFLGLFLLGLCALKSDAIERVTANRRRIAAFLGVSAAVWLTAVFIQTHLGRWWPPSKSRPTVAEALFHVRALRPVVLSLITHSATWGNAAVYAAALALLASFGPIARMLRPLAAVGRMSLTTYLVQSLISVMLFYNYGFGLYGKVGYAGMAAIAAVVFSIQMIFSMWWLNRFQFGPLEWLWRSAAYGKLQPIRAENLPLRSDRTTKG